jgi:hypothetical protein
MPPRPPTIKFQDINDDEEDEDYSPPPPTPKKQRQRDPDDNLVRLLVFKMACDKCQRGGRDCLVVVGNGDACRACKDKKYKCSHRGIKDLETMQVTRPIQGSDVLPVEDTKGKKRKAESPVPPTKRKTKVEKVEKQKKPKETKVRVEGRVQPKASGSKPAGRRRAKSTPAIVDSTSGEEEVEEEEEEEEEEELKPKPKRARIRGQVSKGK